LTAGKFLNHEKPDRNADENASFGADKNFLENILNTCFFY